MLLGVDFFLSSAKVSLQHEDLTMGVHLEKLFSRNLCWVRKLFYRLRTAQKFCELAFNCSRTGGFVNRTEHIH